MVLCNVMMTLFGPDGTTLRSTNFTIAPHQQISRLITEFFQLRISTRHRHPRGVLRNSVGHFASPISVLGLNVTGQNVSIIPLVNVSQLTFPLPLISLGVGGLGADLFPQFLVGGGFTTEIMVLNTSPSPQTVRTRCLRPDGTPLIVTLNGRTASSFTNFLYLETAGSFSSHK